MPVLKSGSEQAPAWCEMTYFQVVDLPAGSTHRFARRSQKEKLIVGRGNCRIAFLGQVVDAQEGANLDLTTPEGCFEILDAASDVTLVWLCGHWGEELGGSGLFTVENNDARRDRGDAVGYEKKTGFDSHYHDCDEYWILFAGRGVAVSEGVLYEVGPGDCIATRIGHHHDFPLVHEPVRAAYFETTLRGQKRRGHLWNHTHGPAQPQTDQA